MKHWLGSGNVAFALALALAQVLAPAAVLGAEASAGPAAYEKYCANCHRADARKLARSTLTLTGDTLVTNRGASELRSLLDNHGRARGAEADQIHALLRSYIAAPRN
jgi:mono/diheme cytochrome c family protein